MHHSRGQIVMIHRCLYPNHHSVVATKTINIESACTDPYPPVRTASRCGIWRLVVCCAVLRAPWQAFALARDLDCDWRNSAAVLDGCETAMVVAHHSHDFRANDVGRIVASDCAWMVFVGFFADAAGLPRRT